MSMKDCNAAFSKDGFLFILSHYDFMVQATCDTSHLITLHNIVLEGMSGMSLSLPGMVENVDGHLRLKLLNASKMYINLFHKCLCSLMKIYDEKTHAKSLLKAIKSFDEFNWDEKRKISLLTLHKFINQPLPKLWDPPVADEDFVNTAANCCYKMLEDPQVSREHLSHLRHSIFDILGLLIKKYGHGLSCAVKMVQLMKLYEHLPETLAEGAVKFQSRSFLHEVIREITEDAAACETRSYIKACSHFLIKIAKEGPEVMLVSVDMLLPMLDNDSYLMRNCVLVVLGEIVSLTLAMKNLSPDQKEIRDIFFEHLEDHLLDTNSFVRAKVLKIWQRLCQEKAIPLARLNQLSMKIVDRLQDISWSVTRNAIQLYHSLLKSNPFGDKDCIVFAEQLETATNIINNLLSCAQPKVILDAIEFLTTACQFGLKGALTGVQNMLMLVWSSESSIRDAVAAAYRNIYIETESHYRQADEIFRNLFHLLKTLNGSQQAALEVLVHEWVKAGDMDKECFQIMWERFSMKLPDTTEDESRAALILLGMVGGASQSILKNNIPVLMSVGLGERGRKDYRLVIETCRTLLKLVPEATLVSSKEETFILSKDHEMFQNLCSIITNGFNVIDERDYLSMAIEALDVIYQLSEHPDKTCSALLNTFCELSNKAASGNLDSLKSSNQGSAKTLGKVDFRLLERLVAIIGHIAFRQWIHLDTKILRELKRRNAIRKIELEREINADDEETECINQICETEIVTGDTILKNLSPLVVSICTNPQKYSDKKLQSIASNSLTKLMIISSAFCEEHLALVFTMMEKSHEPQIRSNLVYAVGDLVNRFPTLLDPWIKSIYARLGDKCPNVRLDTMVVLRHLITNETVKVRGQISDLALCIVDPVERISVMASEFFRDLSKKGNTLYNVMPDIISMLSNPSMNVSEDHFHGIFEFLLPLINKDKQVESLVVKLCQRFRASTFERQRSDIAFCLSVIHHSDRSLRHLTENFQCYFDKLITNNVYKAFESIINEALKTNKAERKVIVEELQGKIDEIMIERLGLKGTRTGHFEDAGEGTEGDGKNQKGNRLTERMQAAQRRGRSKQKRTS